MLRHLFPTEGKDFFDVFERHAAVTLEAANKLREILEDPAKAETFASEIKALEHQGDTITHDAIARLHKTFLTPIDRLDIHRLITRLDDILDLIDSTAERVALYEIGVMDPDARSLGNVLSRTVTQVLEAMRLLRNLKDREAILEVCKEINSLENEGDATIRLAVARLFREEKDPIVVIKWKEIYDYLEDAIDRCEDVANVLEGVALEYA